MQNINQMVDPQKTSYTSPWRASYGGRDGGSFANICEKIDHVIMAPYCSWNPFHGWYEPIYPTTWRLGDARIQGISSNDIDLVVLSIRRVNSLWPSDAIWQQRSGSTLALVMACCLMAPSHYLSQCWLIISDVQVTFISGWFHNRWLNHQSLKSVWKLRI